MCRGRGRHAPICFRPGKIGNKRELRLSPQHQVLLSGWRCELMGHSTDLLCAAKHLCDGDPVFAAPCAAVTYVHFMCDRHEIVFAEGAPTESVYAGDYITEADRDCHAELIELFPELASRRHLAEQAARRFATKHETLCCNSRRASY